MKKYRKPKFTIKKLHFNFFSRNSSWDYKSKFENSFLLSACSYLSTCDDTCFLANTKILLTDNSKKNIEKVKSGDRVRSYSFKSSKFVSSIVDKLLVHNNTKGYFILNNNIKVTEEHLFWANNRWKRAGDLKEGDLLFNHEGSKESINSIKKVSGANKVYNLHLKGKEHNYFAEGYLVHNVK